MKYLIFFLIAVNIFSIDKFYYNFNKKIYLEDSSYYLGIKTKYNFSIEGVKKQVENLNGIDKIESVKNIGSNLFLFKFSSKIDDIKNILKKAPFVKYEINGFYLKNIHNEKYWPMFIDKRIVIKFKNNISITKINEILKENSLYIKNKKNINYKIFLIAKTNININAILSISNKLDKLPEVDFAHPDFISIYKKFYTPNDTYFPDQWHHKNGIGGVDSVDAWDITRGSKSIKIAIVDDGIDLIHEDLNVIAHKNFSTEDANAGAEHGTACAGVSAAIGDNGKGMVGICPNCSLISAKLLSESGAVYGTAIAEAFRWAVLMGADVISNSWGAETAQPVSPETVNAINFATTKGRNGKGCIITFAVGNDNRALKSFETSSLGNVIGVGASDYQDKRAVYSNFGDYVSVVAPSSAGTYESFHIPEGNIFTTDRTGALGYNNNGTHSEYYVRELDMAGNYTKFFGGTSSACPLVAGMAALILSEAPNLTYQQVINIIKDTTDKIGGAGEYDNNGYSTNFGYGKVNVRRALLRAKSLSNCIPNPNGEICDNSIDDDCDGFVDNSDSDCNNNNPCAQYSCPDNSTCVFHDNFNSEVLDGIKISCDCNIGYKKQGDLCVVDTSYDPCKGILCSNHGTCEAVTMTEVKCNCDSDSHKEGDNGLICRKNEPCTFVQCEDSQFCSNNDAKCHCKRGYYEDGNKCLKYKTGSLCENAMCSENSKCSNEDGDCHCNDGYEIRIGTECVLKENKPQVVAKTKDDSNCSFSNNNSINYLFLLILIIFISLRKKIKN